MSKCAILYDKMKPFGIFYTGVPFMIIQASNFGTQGKLKCGYYAGKYDLDSHFHQLAELIVVLEGEIWVTVNGRRLTAAGGSAVLIPPFSPHSFETPERCEIWICLFSADFVQDVTEGRDVFAYSRGVLFKMSEGVLAYTLPRLMDNRQQFMTFTADSKRQAKTLLHVFYNEAAEAASWVKDTGGIGATLRAISLYVTEHAKEDITRESVADALGLHPVYVSRCCNAIPNMNFRRLLNSARIDIAKDILATTNLKLINVALECGFTCERSFHRAFVEICGCTPGEYRRRGEA